MLVNGKRVALENEKNVLEVVRKAGVELPTFCYHSELSTYGACRMCVVENKWGNVFASCSEIPKDGMEIRTNTSKLRKHRKMILELILANHCRDCTTCEKNGKCKLQELAERFNIRDVRFPTPEEKKPIDKSSFSVIRDPNKCIYCGDCVRMCQEVQGVGVIGFAYRGAEVEVTPAFNRCLSSVNCVNCGQCAATCPTGALVIKNETKAAWKLINDSSKKVIAQIAPAVRVALGEEFGMASNRVVTGKIVAALKALGFDEVYDTSIGADLTVVEETNEFVERLSKGDNEFPLFTSCCPGWYRFAETQFPELMDHVSSCKSPQQMFGTVMKKHFETVEDDREISVVSIMPCTAKKYEAARSNYEVDGIRDVDIVITTQELARMIKEAGIVFDEIEPESFDMPFGLASGAGVIFGVTGGVTEAVLRRTMHSKGVSALKDIEFMGVRGMDCVKETEVEINGNTVKIAIVHGLGKAKDLIEKIKSGEKQYDFVEVMACKGGCIGGAGQPFNMDPNIREERTKGIYKADSMSQIKFSSDNPVVDTIYNEILKDETCILHNGCHK